jgi:hypothetical protein
MSQARRVATDYAVTRALNAGLNVNDPHPWADAIVPLRRGCTRITAARIDCDYRIVAGAGRIMREQDGTAVVRERHRHIFVTELHRPQRRELRDTAPSGATLHGPCVPDLPCPSHGPRPPWALECHPTTANSCWLWRPGWSCEAAPGDKPGELIVNDDWCGEVFWPPDHARKLRRSRRDRYAQVPGGVGQRRLDVVDSRVLPVADDAP